MRVGQELLSDTVGFVAGATDVSRISSWFSGNLLACLSSCSVAGKERVTDNAVQVRIRVGFGVHVGMVQPQDNINLLAVPVPDPQIGDGRTMMRESDLDALRLDSVFALVVDWPHGRQCCKGTAAFPYCFGRCEDTGRQFS